MATSCSPVCLFWGVVWFLLLIWIAFFVAGVCASLYIILSPLSVCIPPLAEFADLLLKGLQLPKSFAENMIYMHVVMMNAFVRSEYALMVTNIHPVVTQDECTDLLAHFGATNVTVRRHRRHKSALARFSCLESAKSTISGLHQLSLAGRRLVVVFCDTDAVTAGERQVYGCAENEDCVDLLVQDEVVLRRQKAVDELCESAVPAPYLCYHYPPPSVGIMARISAQMFLSRPFYTQVLHLMNKLALPAPFHSDKTTEPCDSTSLTAASCATSPSSSTVGTQTECSFDENKAASSSEESEMAGSDQEVPVTTDRQTDREELCCRVRSVCGSCGQQLPAVSPLSGLSERSRRRVQSAVRQMQQDRRPVKRSRVDHVPARAARSVVVIAPVTQLPTAASESRAGRVEQAPETAGFPLLASSRSVSDDKLNNSETTSVQQEITEFLTDKQLAENRLSAQEMQKLPVCAKYSCGDVSSRLYVKNIDKRVQQRDLVRIYGKYIDWRNELHVHSFDVRLMQQGRMKGQAFISLPSSELSRRALADTHGFILFDKPLVVQFARSATTNAANTITNTR